MVVYVDCPDCNNVIHIDLSDYEDKEQIVIVCSSCGDEFRYLIEHKEYVSGISRLPHVSLDPLKKPPLPAESNVPTTLWMKLEQSELYDSLLYINLQYYRDNPKLSEDETHEIAKELNDFARRRGCHVDLHEAYSEKSALTLSKDNLPDFERAFIGYQGEMCDLWLNMSENMPQWQSAVKSGLTFGSGYVLDLTRIRKCTNNNVFYASKSPAPEETSNLGGVINPLPVFSSIRGHIGSVRPTSKEMRDTIRAAMQKMGNPDLRSETKSTCRWCKGREEILLLDTWVPCDCVRLTPGEEKQSGPMYRLGDRLPKNTVVMHYEPIRQMREYGNLEEEKEYERSIYDVINKKCLYKGQFCHNFGMKGFLYPSESEEETYFENFNVSLAKHWNSTVVGHKREETENGTRIKLTNKSELPMFLYYEYRGDD